MTGADSMMGVRRKHAFLLLALGVTGTWQPSWAAEFQCRHGDRLRRVEVTTGEAAAGAACEVRYWRDASTPGDGRVLWRASQDVEFCEDKARDLLARLGRGGWACGASEPPREPEPSERAAAPPATRGSRPAAAVPDAGPRQAPEPDEPAPAAAAIAERSASLDRTPADGQVEPPAPVEAALPAIATTVEPSTSIEQPMPSAVARAAPSPPAEEPTAAPADDPPADNTNVALLDRVVGQTLRSVEQMYGGDFRAEDTAFGDLDGDGRDDAVVLVTYQTEHEDYVQYLVAYRFDGETFQSIATKNVGGRFLDALRADVRGIVDRAILVDLQALDAAEACCETHRAAFVLREGQLVEAEETTGAPGRRS